MVKLDTLRCHVLQRAESKEIPSPSTEVAEHGKAQVNQKAEAVASPALDDLKQEVNSLTESLNALKESLDALKESQGDLAEVKSLAEALEKSQVSTLADVEALRSLVEEGEPAQKVTNLAEEVEALRRQVTEGEPAQKVEHLDTTVRELQDIHEDLKKKVEKASSAEAEIADLKQQVKGLGETVAKTAETLNRSENQSEVSKLKEAFEAMKRRQEEFNLQTEATQRKQLNTIREDMRVVQASQEASAKRQAQIKEGTQSLEKEQLQLASKLRQLEGGRIKQLGQDMQVVKEAILHVQQELRKEVVIPEHVLKDLDAKNESRLEAVWTELQHHAEAAATRADRLEQSLTQRVVHLEHATTILVKAEEHTRSLEQDMQKQSEWFSWRIAWLEWATTGEKRSFARALLPPPSTPAATCFKQPLTEDSELWAQEKTGRQRLRRAPLNNMPNVGSANERCLAVTSPSLSVSSSAPDLQAVGKGREQQHSLFSRSFTLPVMGDSFGSTSPHGKYAPVSSGGSPAHSIGGISATFPGSHLGEWFRGSTANGFLENLWRSEWFRDHQICQRVFEYLRGMWTTCRLVGRWAPTRRRRFLSGASAWNAFS
eukprot:symbB.v1.2.014946.t1/scaffold1102.1/size137770/12